MKIVYDEKFLALDPCMVTDVLHEAEETLDGSMHSKKGKRYECVTWHENNFDCTPWKGEDPLIGPRNYKAMWDFHVAVCKSVANWIAGDQETLRLMRLSDSIRRSKGERDDSILWFGYRCVRYVCEGLSYWYTDAEGEPQQPHGLPWSDFDICSYQSKLTNEQRKYSYALLRDTYMHVR